MQYIKASFTLNPDNEINREILTAYLSELAFESFEETEESVLAFFPQGQVSDADIEQATASLPFQAEYSLEEMPDINWNEEWEKNYFEPLLIQDNCLIRAPFHKEYPKAQYEIVIEPNMAFGTGNHETTSLMIEHLNELDVTGKAVLDMGCGTGILGIYASMRGCSAVTAIDIDSWAFESVVENCRLNSIDNMKAFIGDASLLINQSFDLILANIQKNVILQDIERYLKVLKTGGLLVLSGFYKEDLADIQAKCAELNLKQEQLKEKNNWIAVSFKK